MDAKLIEPLKVGHHVTLLDTEKANEVINAVNKLLSARIVFDPARAAAESRTMVSETNALHVIGTKPPIK